MPTIRLTPRGIAALRTVEAQVEFWDDVVPGLALRVSRRGRKTYIVRYRAGGKHRRLALGRHPHLSLADARSKARAALADVQGGVDPALEQQLRRSTDASFATLAAEVLQAKAATTRRRTQLERDRILRAELLPAWGARPAASITRRDVVQLVERIALRGSPIMANRTLATIKVIFATGLKRGFPTLEASPAQLVEPTDEPARRRYLDRQELRTVWGVLADEAPLSRVLFRLALLTAQRIGSLRALRWADIDTADVWHIPAADFKGRRPHLVPLSAEARAVLEELHPLTGGEEYVFPGRSGAYTPHRNSVTVALKRIRDASGLAPWTVHDFRTTFRTWATRAERPKDKRDPAGLGVVPHVADAVLGHKEASLGYDRYTSEPETYLLSEKREALARWGRFVLTATRAR